MSDQERASEGTGTRLPGHARPSRAAPLAAFVLVLTVTVAACCLRIVQTPSTSGPRCPLDRQLVPSCGALLGITPPSPDRASLRAAERSVGHRFDLVYSFHDINDTVPSTYDRQVVASGARLHITIDSRDYGSDDRSSVRWADVARGVYDADLRRQARGIASLRQPVFVTFDHEADQPSRTAVGTPAEYVAAWRHVHDVFATAGARNAVWVWVMLGWPPSFPTAARMWPGNRFVDWISWDAYDDAGCRVGAVDPAQRQSFAQVALPFLTWLRQSGRAAGIDVSKPLMVSETGTVDPAGRTAWFAGMRATLRTHPAIKAVTLWDHAGSSSDCDFRFSGDRTSAAAVGRLAGSAWFNPLAQLPADSAGARRTRPGAGDS
jgi:hypothetical protein